MNRYAVIDGNVITHVVYANEAIYADWRAIPDSASEGWLWNDESQSFLPPPPAPADTTKITRLAFSNRFTLEEEVLIEEAAISDPTVRVILRKLDNATYIDLALSQTSDMLNLMVSKELITADRANEILTTDVLPDEAFKG